MKNLQVRTYTDIAVEPVTLDEAKSVCRITGTQDDILLSIMITSARQTIERYLNASVAEKTLHATWIEPPDDDVLELPYGPHIAVSAVYRIDSEGTETLLTVNSDYWVYGDQDLVLKVNKYWSSSGSAAQQSIRVEYTAGYGNDSTETLPEVIRLAILKEVVTQYEMRENITPGGAAELSNEAKRLIAPYRKKIWF